MPINGAGLPAGRQGTNINNVNVKSKSLNILATQGKCGESEQEIASSTIPDIAHNKRLP